MEDCNSICEDASNSVGSKVSYKVLSGFWKDLVGELSNIYGNHSGNLQEKMIKNHVHWILIKGVALIKQMTRNWLNNDSLRSRQPAMQNVIVNVSFGIIYFYYIFLIISYLE